MTITEKVAFLKGLIEGSEIKLEKKEQRIFELLVEIVDDMANFVADIDEDVSELYDGMADFDEVIDDLDYRVSLLDDGEYYDEDDEDFMYEIQCEKCGETICVDEDTLLAEDIVCPACGEPIEFEFDCDCGCGEEGCEHNHDEE